MERALYIKNFRNIGLGKAERLVLNHELHKGKCGNLVILIGANNSGKSNVLDALYTYKNQKFRTQDRTNIDASADYDIQELTLTSKDDEGNVFSYSVNSAGQTNVICPQSTKVPFTKETLNNALSIIGNCFTDVHAYNFPELTQRLKNIQKNVDTFSEEELLNELKKVYIKIKSGANSFTTLRSLYSNIKSNLQNESLVNYLELTTQTAETLIASQYLAKFNTPFMPAVIKYEDQAFRTADTQASPNGLTNNKFFKNLFKATKIDEHEIVNTYNIYNNTQHRGALTQMQAKLNKNLKKVIKDFNKIYFLDEGTYKFSITLETNNVFFEISKDDISLNLDYQSTGFRWFFDLYFNLLCNNDLNSGDILVMDEPATNLHVQGQIELRNFLKEFAIKNDITIVLVTHSPFLIDMNYLDEIRVICTKDGRCYIKNDFSAVDPDDPNSLKPIKEALTVHNHILLDPDKKVVFVEGITDYNYMTAFAQILNKKDIVFLPIKGVGDITDSSNKAKQQEIIKSLLKIRKTKVLLMLDGDKAGKDMEKACEDTALPAFNLSKVDSNFKTIENLFDKDDISKFGLKEKHAGTSSLLKSFEKEDSFSKTTIDNFKKLIDYIDNN